jgi:hypothetical protein
MPTVKGIVFFLSQAANTGPTRKLRRAGNFAFLGNVQDFDRRVRELQVLYFGFCVRIIERELNHLVEERNLSQSTCQVPVSIDVNCIVDILICGRERNWQLMILQMKYRAAFS